MSIDDFTRSSLRRGMIGAVCVGALGVALSSLAVAAAPPAPSTAVLGEAVSFNPFTPARVAVPAVSAPVVAVAATAPPTPVRVPYRPPLRSPSRP